VCKKWRPAVVLDNDRKISPVTSISPIVPRPQAEPSMHWTGSSRHCAQRATNSPLQRADLHRWTLRHDSLIIDLGT
jgi:hypothetical protein